MMDAVEKVKTVAIPQTVPVKIVVAAGAFLVPFALGHPQPVVGTLVNAALFLAAGAFPPSWWWGLVILPSLAVILRGAVFGPFTPFLLYFAPFIWASNYLLVFLFSRFYGRMHVIWSLLLPSLAKSAFLFGIAFIMVRAGIVPKMYLTAMGPVQLATALAGGIVAQGVLRITYGHKNPGT